MNQDKSLNTASFPSMQNSKISEQAYIVEKRKEFKAKRWICWFLPAIAVYFAILPIGNTQHQPGTTTSASSKYGYYYKGQYIPLNPSKELIVISEAGVTFSPFARTQGLERDYLSDRKQLKDSKLGLYRLPTPTSKTERRMSLRPQMEHFALSAGEEIQPVFEQGQSLLIPSNEVIVRFKGTLTIAQVRTYFEPYQKTQGIVEVIAHRKNTYVLRIDNPSNGRVYQVCQFLIGLDEIDFAEPNHIVILLDVPIIPILPNGAPTGGYQGGGGGGNSTRNSTVTWEVLENENFEGTSIPSGWSTGRLGNSNADAHWSVTDYRSHADNQCLYATGGGSEGVMPPGNYPNNSYSWLNTPTFNLASYEEVYIELWFYAKYEDTDPARCSVPDLGLVGIYNPSSDTTTYLSALAVCYTGDLTADPTTDNGWRRALVRIPPALHQDGVNVRIAFRSDNNGTREGLYVDQVRVVGTTDVDTEPLGNDTYSARLYEMKNVGQIAGLGNDKNDMNVPEAWNLVSISSDVVVAVIDSGVDLNHPDLNLVVGYDPDGTEGGGIHGSHGTAVAGNVGAIGGNSLGVIGTAPGVKIMPVYMGGNVTQFADAIDVAVANDADVLSNSWGWVGSPSADIEEAINDALNAGRVVLFAAGNGPDRPPWTYKVSFPGSLTGSSDVICVGASSPTDEHKAAASSDGAFGWGSSYVGDGPDITSPSPWSYTTDIQGAGGYNDGSLIDPADPNSADYTPGFGGTSSATPKVAGIVALMLSACPDLTPHQVKDILRELADDIDLPGIDDKTGAGRVNAEKAVQKALGMCIKDPETKYEYAAKFVCGLQKDPWDMRLTRGYYASAINIHNPNNDTVRFYKKLALTFPPKGQRPGKIIPIGKDELKYDEALEVDCEEIDKALKESGITTPYSKGFVIIQSSASLDVTAVYTTAALDKEGRVTDHSSIDVEQISERQIVETEQKLADLIPVPDQGGFL